MINYYILGCNYIIISYDYIIFFGLKNGLVFRVLKKLNIFISKKIFLKFLILKNLKILLEIFYKLIYFSKFYSNKKIIFY